MFIDRPIGHLQDLIQSDPEGWELDGGEDPLASVEMLRPWLRWERDEAGRRFPRAYAMKKFYSRVLRQFRATHGVLKQLAVLEGCDPTSPSAERALRTLTGKWGLMEKQPAPRMTLEGVPKRLMGDLDPEIADGLVEQVAEGNRAIETLRPWMLAGTPLTGDLWESVKEALTRYRDAIESHHMDGSEDDWEDEYHGIYCPVCGHKVQGVDRSGTVCTPVEPGHFKGAGGLSNGG